MSHLERVDGTLQDIIQRGILLDAEHGAVNAWIFMKKNGVDEAVMLRVLAYPDKRRTSDASMVRSARSDGLPLRQRRVKIGK